MDGLYHPYGWYMGVHWDFCRNRRRLHRKIAYRPAARKKCPECLSHPQELDNAILRVTYQSLQSLAGTLEFQ